MNMVNYKWQIVNCGKKNVSDVWCMWLHVAHEAQKNRFFYKKAVHFYINFRVENEEKEEIKYQKAKRTWLFSRI